MNSLDKRKIIARAAAVLCTSLLLLLIAACEVKNATKETDEVPPNVILLLTDDQSYTTIAALGNDVIRTPNLDRLVRGGTTFTHAYNMGGWNGAICMASRAMLISGLPIWRANEFRRGWTERDSAALDRSWGRMMEKAGYQTYMTGKWHVDAPPDMVFQDARHPRPGMPGDAWEHHRMESLFVNEVYAGKVSAEEIMPVGYNRPLNETDDSWSPTDSIFGGFWEGGIHWSEVVRNDALDFLDKAGQSEDPYFMYLAFNAPHDPRQAPRPYLDLYPVGEMPLPESWQPDYPDRDKMGNGRRLRDEALAPFPRTPYATKVHLREYYAIISHLDAQIGILLDELERRGEMDNTVIFFTSDHGLSVGRHGLVGKQNMYDHSIRVPLIAYGKGVPADRRIDADVYLQDVMATALELAGADRPGDLFFRSLNGLMEGSETQSYPAIYGAYVDWQRMIRKDEYKLILYPKMEKVLLFDLENDPEETNNLAEAPEQAERVKSLFGALLQLQKEMNDPLDLTDWYHAL